MFADDMVVLLATASVTVTGIGAKYKLPPGDGPYTILAETGGTSPERTQNTVATPAYLRPSLQVVVHAKDQAVARALAKTALLALTGIRNQTINGVWYREINTVQSEPMDLGQDDAGRARCSFNIDAIKRPS